jgi:type I restriction enzyme S subunit
MESRQLTWLDARTARLLPNSFDDSSIGPVHGKWKVGRLDDLDLVQRGFDLPPSERLPGPYPVVSGGRICGSHSEPKVKAPGVAKGRAGLLGEVRLRLDDYWFLNTVLRVKEFRGAGPYLAYQHLKVSEFGLLNAESAVPTLNRNHVHNLPVCIPPAEVARAFEELAGALHVRARSNERESLTLAALRDALLPKLLSGEIRTKDAETAVETHL